VIHVELTVRRGTLIIGCADEALFDVLELFRAHERDREEAE